MRIINQETVSTPVKKLKPHPENPRQGDIGAIHESIKHLGFYGAIIAQKSTGHLEPKYVAVILERLSEMGLEPKRQE